MRLLSKNTTYTLNAKEFRRRRKEKGLSQGVIAKKAGVHTSFLCEIEKGKRIPKSDLSIRLVRALMQ